VKKHTGNIEKAAASTELIDYAYRAYGIGAVSSVRDLGGAFNLNLLLTARERRVILRVHRPWVTVERMGAVNSVKAHVRAAGIPVPMTMRALSGSDFEHFQGRILEVEEHILADDEEAGGASPLRFRMLGRLHAALSSIEGASGMPQPVVQNYLPLQELAAWISETRRLIRGGRSSQAESALRLCDAADRSASAIRERLAEVGGSMPRQLVHGDYGAGNVLLRNGDIVGVIDWDFCAFHERVYDLAYSLFWEWARASHGDAKPFMENLVSAYEEGLGASLSSGERDVLPLMAARVPLYWIGEARWLPDPAASVLAMEHAMDAARRLADTSGKRYY
jgi:Ser/Thr protein kinase RdoA (MazF antagonist)